jgi:hypothetical protein
MPQLQNELLGQVDMQHFLIGRAALTLANALDWRPVAALSLLIIYYSLKKGYTGAEKSDFDVIERC